SSYLRVRIFQRRKSLLHRLRATPESFRGVWNLCRTHSRTSSSHRTQAAASHRGRKRRSRSIPNPATDDCDGQINGCSDHGEPCGQGYTLYPSSKSAPVEVIIHHGGHIYPPTAPTL